MSDPAAVSAGAEAVVSFNVDAHDLLGIVHPAKERAELGVVIVVGGPQYRVGSHRQFVLMARALAAAGYPTLRFDHRGIGDSDGPVVPFDGLSADIAAAIDALQRETGVQQVILWGLCDAASAILIYRDDDPRVAGVVLLNPWVHNEQVEAQVRLRSYYLGRLASRDFWGKLLRLELDIGNSVASLAGYVRRLMPAAGDAGAELGFIERMLDGLRAGRTPALVILSGDDLVAAEFEQLVSRDGAWQAALAKRCPQPCRMPAANHTFSSRAWRGEVEDLTLAWLHGISRQ